MSPHEQSYMDLRAIEARRRRHHRLLLAFQIASVVVVIAALVGLGMLMHWGRT